MEAQTFCTAPGSAHTRPLPQVLCGPELAEAFFGAFTVDKQVTAFTFANFLQGMRVLMLGTVRDKAAFCFRIADLDGDGTLSFNEFQLVFSIILGPLVCGWGGFGKLPWVYCPRLRLAAPIGRSPFAALPLDPLPPHPVMLIGLSPPCVG